MVWETSSLVAFITRKCVRQERLSASYICCCQKEWRNDIPPVLKDDIRLELEPVTNANEIRACNALCQAIERAIYKEGTTDLREIREFRQFLLQP
jgi:hypothetical protein